MITKEKRLGMQLLTEAKFDKGKATKVGAIK